MRLDLNGTPTEITAPTLAEALTELGYQTSALATALNGRFVPAGERAATPLREGDQIEVLAPMQGG